MTNPSNKDGPISVFVFAGAVVVGGAAAYLNSFRGPFVLDDLASILGNPTLRHLWPLPGPLATPHGAGLTVEGRPVLNLSFALNYAFGGTQVLGYHLVNAMIHLAAGLVLFGIVRRTLGQPGLACAAALLWMVHPVQTEAVTYIAQRAESLMGLFYLLTLYGFIREWFGLSFFACLLGMGTKEVMVSAPVVVWLYDRTFLAGGFREAWRARRRYYLSLASTWLLLAWLVAHEGSRGGTSAFGSGVGVGRYWLSQFPAVTRYLALALWPRSLVFDYGTLWAHSVLAVAPQIAAVLALVALTAWALWRRPKWGFLGFCFFAVLAPTSLVPGNRQTMAEHRLYLALAPLMVAIVVAGSRLLGYVRNAKWRAVVSGVAMAIAAGVLIAATRRRNEVYRTDLSLESDTVAKVPGNPYAQCNLGTAWFAQGRPREALPCFAEAVRLKPDFAIARADLGDALLRVGRPLQAAEQLRTAVALQPNYAKAYNNLGAALQALGRWADAVAPLRRAVQLEPNNADARYNLGGSLLQSGRPLEAAESFKVSVRLNPGDRDALYNLGCALQAAGRPAEAQEALQRAAALRRQ